MRTLNQIKKEMDEIQVSISTDTSLNKSQISRLKKRYAFLKVCFMYMKSEPTNEFLYKEKERLANKINLINKGYVPDPRLLAGRMDKEEKKEHKDYNKIMGMDKWKDQLKSINFLLA